MVPQKTPHNTTPHKNALQHATTYFLLAGGSTGDHLWDFLKNHTEMVDFDHVLVYNNLGNTTTNADESISSLANSIDLFEPKIVMHIPWPHWVWCVSIATCVVSVFV